MPGIFTPGCSPAFRNFFFWVLRIILMNHGGRTSGGYPSNGSSIHDATCPIACPSDQFPVARSVPSRSAHTSRSASRTISSRPSNRIARCSAAFVSIVPVGSAVALADMAPSLTLASTNRP
ncbi:MAG: hypothetical protein R3B68_01390 [Phycisphaerales bacterium]